MTLKQIRETLPKGKWWHSQIFEDASVAIGKLEISPEEFWAWPERKRAWFLAYYRAEATMIAWEHYLHEQEIKEASRKSGRKRPRS